jgi:hypothetical protein
MVMGRIFSARNTINLFRPGLNPARPEKCSPLIVVGFPAVQYQMLLQTICVRVVSVCVVPCHSEKKMMLQSMTSIWFVNSMRGWCGVKKKIGCTTTTQLVWKRSRNKTAHLMNDVA